MKALRWTEVDRDAATITLPPERRNNDVQLDLVRPFADPSFRSVTIELRDLHVLHVAGATMEQQGGAGRSHCDLARQQLGHRRLARTVASGHAQPRRAIDHQAGCVDMRREIRDFEGDALELADRFAEGLALARVARG